MWVALGIQLQVYIAAAHLIPPMVNQFVKTQGEKKNQNLKLPPELCNEKPE
jgi:hypothetical protein